MLTEPPPRLEATAVNVTDVPEQIAPFGLPLMLRIGVELGFTVIDIDSGDVDPQALLAITVIVPPLLDAVVVILFVVELPVQPAGMVQV